MNSRNKNLLFYIRGFDLFKSEFDKIKIDFKKMKTFDKKNILISFDKIKELERLYDGTIVLSLIHHYRKEGLLNCVN